MTPEDLAAIEARWTPTPNPADLAHAVADIRALLAEVKRLKDANVQLHGRFIFALGMPPCK